MLLTTACVRRQWQQLRQTAVRTPRDKDLARTDPSRAVEATRTPLASCRTTANSRAIQISRQGHGRVGTAVRRHPHVICSFHTDQDKAALRSPFESKDQAGAARQGRLADFRTPGSTERAFHGTWSIDYLGEVN